MGWSGRNFSAFQNQYTAVANLIVGVLTSGLGVFSVRMKIVRRPAGQIGCTDESDGGNVLTMGLERAIVLHCVNATGLAAMWIGLL